MQIYQRHTLFYPSIWGPKCLLEIVKFIAGTVFISYVQLRRRFSKNASIPFRQFLGYLPTSYSLNKSSHERASKCRVTGKLSSSYLNWCQQSIIARCCMCSEPPSPRAQGVQQAAIPLNTASKMSTAAFTSQLAEFSKNLIS